MDASDVTLRTTRGQRVGEEWVPVTRGVRRRVDAPDPLVATLRAWQEVLPPEAAFTHLTAAAARRWWLPPLPDELPVFVALPPGAVHLRRPGLVTIRRARVVEPVTVSGLRLDPAPMALGACARDLGDLDLLCLMEAAVAREDCTPAQVAAAAAARCRGAPRMRRVLTRVDGRAESIWEVLLRELHRACDVEVEPQHEVLDEAGTFVARGDLWLVGTQELHEYDGDVHSPRSQQRRDRKRERRLGRTDWTRRGYVREDVLHQGVTVLADADRALGRPHEPARIRAWHDLLRESLFTPAGTERFRRRLGLPGTGAAETA